MLWLHVGTQHTRRVLKELLLQVDFANCPLAREAPALASMMVTRKWLARSRPAARPEKLPPITSTRRLGHQSTLKGVARQGLKHRLACPHRTDHCSGMDCAGGMVLLLPTENYDTRRVSQSFADNHHALARSKAQQWAALTHLKLNLGHK